jgi:multicomponent Na+:H+ antiporter subunit G
MIVVSTVLMLVGLFFLVVSAVGLDRLPEVYTRAHAVAKSETLGLLLVFSGLFFRPELDAPTAVRLVFVLIFSVIANPTAVHALVRAARRSGVQPWKVGESAEVVTAAIDPDLRQEVEDTPPTAPGHHDGSPEQEGGR